MVLLVDLMIKSKVQGEKRPKCYRQVFRSLLLGGEYGHKGDIGTNRT